MTQASNIYLIGLMGVGKTTIGKQLARALKRPFYDSDKVIEQLAGTDIPTIFSYEGEEGFREREQKVIHDLCQLEHIVMATGGGSILRAENRHMLKTTGFTVYLHCSIDKILNRTKQDTQRPLLQTENPRKKLQSLLAEREAFYLDCANFKIDSGAIANKTIVKTILQQYDLLLRPHENTER